MKSKVREQSLVSLCPSLGTALISEIVEGVTKFFGESTVNIEVSATPLLALAADSEHIAIMPYAIKHPRFSAKRVAIYRLEMFELACSGEDFRRSKSLVLTPEIGLAGSNRELFLPKSANANLVFVDGVDAALGLARSLGSRVILPRWKLRDSGMQADWELAESPTNLPGGEIYINRRDVSPASSDFMRFAAHAIQEKIDHLSK